MTLPTDATIDSRIRQLDERALCAFVAALWTRRGFDTTVDGDCVVASRDGQSVVILPVADSLLGGVEEPERVVDVVVAPGDSANPSTLAARHDARLLATADLRQMLKYALDREAAVTLWADHLEPAGPSVVPSPTGLRRLLGHTAGRVAGIAPSVASVATVALLVTVAGFAVATAGPTVGTGTPGSAGQTTPVSVPSAAETATPDTELAPGLNEDGIADIGALAAAHEQTLSTLSYTLWIDVYRPKSGIPNQPQVQRDVDIAFAGERYRLTTTLSLTSHRNDESRDVEQVVLRAYNDGRVTYFADDRESAREYRRLAGERSSPALVPTPFVADRNLVAWYLSTPKTNLTGTRTVDGRLLYRIVGSGTPAPADQDRVRNYRVIATVDRNGVVHSLTAKYVAQTESGEYPVTFEADFGRFGETSIGQPGWYDREFRSVEATAAPSNTTVANRTVTANATVTGGNESANATASGDEP